MRRVESVWTISVPTHPAQVYRGTWCGVVACLITTAGALGTDVVLMSPRMEKESNNLQKDAKTYLDSMRGEK